MIEVSDEVLRDSEEHRSICRKRSSKKQMRRTQNSPEHDFKNNDKINDKIGFDINGD